MTPEEQAISKLRSTWPQIQRDRVETLELFFVQLRAVDDHIGRPSPSELHESLWGIFGLMSRSYELMLCSINQVEAKNLNGFYVAARGLVETLCSIVWANEKPERLCNLVRFEPLWIGRIMNSGYRKYPDLKTLYSAMSKVAHPNRTSHLLCPRPIEEIKEKGAFGPFSLNLSNSFAQRMINDLASLSPLIIAELNTLISKGEEVIRGGCLMVRVVSRKTHQA